MVVFYRCPNQPNTITECVIIGSSETIMYLKGGILLQKLKRDKQERYYFVGVVSYYRI